MTNFANKTILVTGGAKGIGEAIATYFAKREANVMIIDLDREAAAEVAQRLGCTARIGDVSREEAVADGVDECIGRFGRLDVMINNAGVIGALGSLIETSASDWQKTLGIHLNGAFFGAKHAGRVMKPQRSGSIVSISSASALAGGLGPHAYVTAKAAIIALTRSVAAEYVDYNVRVNAVAPGTIGTSMVEKVRSKLASASEPRAASVTLPLATDDIARAVGFLASDAAMAITGQTLPVDGGLLATGGRVSQFHRSAGSFV